MNVRVETRGEATTGHAVRAADDAPCEVSVNVRADEVGELYLQTIGGA